MTFVGVNVLAGCEALEMVDLHSAAKEDDRKAVVRLLKEGTNVDKRDPYGYTPLHWAAQKGHTHTVQALLAAGASVHVRDKWRRTPLHRAAKEGHKETVAALLDSGAEVNAQGDSNWTPLHCSSFHGQVEIVEMLLSHGADEGAKDIRGRTVAVVCDMAQYDVDQSARQKIRKLLESPPPRRERDVSALAKLPPSLPVASVVDSDDAESAAAAAEAAAAAAAEAAEASYAKTADGSAKAKPDGGATQTAGEVSGVFAVWDTSPGGAGGESGSGASNIGSGELEPGGVMLEDWTEMEDPVWREVWAMLHVPDPDNPDNNLYSEVKTLRKDMKRLRSDLSDTGNDTSSYEGVLGDSTAVASCASDAGADFDATAAAIPEENPGRISGSSSGEETTPLSLSASYAATNGGGGGRGRGGSDVPPTKRQKGWGHGLATPTGGLESLMLTSSVVPDGISRTASEESGDFVAVGARSDVMGIKVSRSEELERMNAGQLRQHVLKQDRLLEKMGKELERLKREQVVARESAEVGSKSRLPVLGRVSIDIATI